MKQSLIQQMKLPLKEQIKKPVMRFGRNFFSLFSLFRFFSLFALLLVWVAPATATALSDWPAQTNQAAVAMPDVYSAEVAEAVLKSGGNAVDASVAAAFVLAVTYPEAGNLGGGGFMTLFHEKQTHFLDYREKAPKAAYRDLYLDAQQKVIPYRSLVGYQASGVPGTVAGLWAVHQKFGSQPWARLLQPAIDLAEQGFKVSQKLEDTRKWYQGWIEGKSAQPLNFSEFFGDLTAGTVKKQPALASTLKRIAKQGQADFYQGETAKLLAEQMAQHDGLMTLDDLKAYEPVWRQPIAAKWHGLKVVSAPPPSSGGIAIAQLLKMKQALDADFQAYLNANAFSEAEVFAAKTHFYAELQKRVYADRAHYLGDPDFVKVPADELIDTAYLRGRMKGIVFDEISNSETMRPGKIESAETTHFSVVDGQGNAVSNTYTLNMPFGSGVVIAKAGFLMNDEMDDFSTKPGVANVFGVVGGKANEIAPEKRMLSSMSPTLVLKDNQIYGVVGTPGGSSIITSVFQTLVNVVDEKMTPQQAVDANRVHHQLLPKDTIFYNPDLPEATKEYLELLGYTLKRNNYLGDMQVIFNTEKGLEAASDNRGRGVSKVFTLP